MSRPLRLEFPGALFHVTSRGNRKQDIFLDDADCQWFLDLMEKTVNRFAWTVLSYALMRNHFHIIIQLTRETLSMGMKWLNGQYARAFNRRHRCVGHLFGERPHAPLIERDTYLLEVLRYVVLNPVRAGLVAHPRDYAWSSYRALAGLVAPPQWLAVDDVLINFGDDRTLACAAFQQFVEAAIGVENNPWNNLVAGSYLGCESWLAETRERIKLKPRSDDHPRAQRIIAQPRIADVIAVVADTFSIHEHRIRENRGGVPRLAVAWLACHEGQLTNREIAAGLRLRSGGHVSELIQRCEKELDRSQLLRAYIDRCVATLRRKNR